MNRKAAAILLIFMVLLALQWGNPAAQPDVWSEQFDTRAFLNPAQTTAFVDTVASHATLHPFRISLQGPAYVPGYAIAVAVAGDYAYVAAMDSGFVVVDISDPAMPTYVTHFMPFSAFDVVVDGDFAYVAGTDLGLVIFDISDPTSPFPIGGYATPEDCYGVDVEGNIVYAAVMDSGVVALNVEDPTDPREMWTFRSPGAIYAAVDAEGFVLFATDITGGFDAIDASSPTVVSLMDHMDIPGEPLGLDVDGPIAYIADMEIGVHMVVVAVPWDLELMGTLPVGTGAMGVTAEGTSLYVSAPDDGFYTIRFDADFNDVELVDSVTTAGSPISSAIAGDYAFVACDESGLQSVKIAEPLPAPLPGQNLATPSSPSGIDTDGVVLYVADGLDGLLIYETTDPASPSLIGSYNTSGSCIGVKAVGPLVFLADGQQGLKVIDVSDHTSPNEIFDVDTPGHAVAVDYGGLVAYIADHDMGLAVIDISTSSMASYDTPDFAVDVEVHGDHAYVADLQGGLQIIDVSNPRHPTLAGAYDRPGAFAIGLTVSGDICYVANDANGLQVIDVSDPTNPSLLTTYDTPGLTRDAVVSGNYAFVTDHDQGMHMLDVTVPSAPSYRGSMATSQNARYLDISGDYVYLSNGADGVMVAQGFDRISNFADNVVQSTVRNTPRIVSHVSLSAAYSDSVLWEVSADNGTTWDEIVPDQSWQELSAFGTELMWRASMHAASAGGIPVCDSLMMLYNDLVPIAVQGMSAEATDGGVELRWDLVTDEAISGFRVYRRESVGASSDVPVHEGLLPPSTRSFSDHTTVAGRGYRYTLGVVKPDGSEFRSQTVSAVAGVIQAALYQNHPNPFNPTTTISFAVPRPMDVKLSIYSPQGKLVRRLIDGAMAAGVRDIEWDGTNQKGQQVASGVYFYRFTAGKFTQTRKMLLLK